MKTRFAHAALLAALPALLLPALARASRPVLDDRAAPRERVEIAILLDTSGSMDGLIDQAKTKLWGLVNTVASARHAGRAPDLRVALYEYGKSSVPARQGHIRQVVGLTRDLDAVSEALFSLRTDGGDEYCGQAIEKAVTELEWSEGDHYRAIFIAGNEPFTQGPVSFKSAISKARQEGITVNTIHCGDEASAQAGQWNAAAALAGGKAMNIDQNAAVATIVTPYDAKLATLGAKLNDTYVAYGTRGKSKASRQRKLDEKAAEAAPAAAADRSVAKASGQYRADDWDLVDGLASGAVSLEALGDDDMPEELAGKNEKQRAAFVKEKAKERQQLQEEIRELEQKRRGFVAEARKKAGPKKDTFDVAVEGAVTEQMSAAGFDFE
ncbi:MAG: VWA domain-containing protein [Deltaproteobacteria bacterium]|nr:VWA domain-containing protein [Deltaproteobacteria bacterium]